VIDFDFKLPTDEEKRKAWWEGFEKAARMGAKATGKTPEEEEAFIDGLRRKFVIKIRESEDRKKDYDKLEREALKDG